MKKNQKLLIISIFGFVLLISLIIGLFLLRKTPTINNRATEPMCPAQGASCTWESDGTATSFKVDVVDETSGKSLLSTTTTDKIVHFTPIPNHQYKCNVTPINSCGEGPSGSAVNTCIPQATPTQEPSATPTITPTPTIISCQQPSTCKTQEACTTDGGTTNGEQCSEAGTVCCVPPNSTPTPTATPTATPSPTNTPTPTTVPSATPTSTPLPTSTTIPTNTPYPTYTPYPTATHSPSSTPASTATPGPTYTPYPTYTPVPTNTGAPNPSPTEIIIAVNNTNTPTPTRQGTAVPTIPSAGVPVAWYIIFIPLALLGLGLIF